MAKFVYILEERDIWSSHDSIVRLGIFSTKLKALKMAKKEYGELDYNGGDVFEPIKNPSNVTICIIEVELNILEEF